MHGYMQYCFYSTAIHFSFCSSFNLVAANLNLILEFQKFCFGFSVVLEIYFS